MAYVSRNPKLRLGTGPSFDARHREQSREPKKKFIFFSEGVQTEPIYFEALSQSSRKKPEVEVEFINRWREHCNRSNQYQVIQDIIGYINEIQGVEDKDKNMLKSYFQQFNGKDPSPETILNVMKGFEKISKKYPKLISMKEHFIQQLKVILTFSTFDKDFDHICLIIDRDKGSFTEKQFLEVIRISKENDFKLGITNPCFEFFLILHSGDLTNLSADDIAENRKVENKTFAERFLQQKMNEISKTYNKNKYDADYFINNFEVGLNNVQKFSTNNEQLKDMVGSSVFEIVKEIIN